MKKYILGSVLSLGILISPAFTHAASLTDDNIKSILSLLSSFGADQSVIDNVQASLTGGTSTNTSSFCYDFKKRLIIGDSGPDVDALQTVLDREGIRDISAADTTFTEEVAGAVVALQAKYGIRQTGVLGPVIRAKLNALYGCSNPTPRLSPFPSVPSSTTFSAWPTSGSAPLVVNFSFDIPSSDIQNYVTGQRAYTLDFGDGAQAPYQCPSYATPSQCPGHETRQHTYTSAGTYKAMLTRPSACNATPGTTCTQEIVGTAIITVGEISLANNSRLTVTAPTSVTLGSSYLIQWGGLSGPTLEELSRKYPTALGEMIAYNSDQSLGVAQTIFHDVPIGILLNGNTSWNVGTLTNDGRQLPSGKYSIVFHVGVPNSGNSTAIAQGNSDPFYLSDKKDSSVSSITVLYPTAGLTFTQGNPITVTWKAVGNPANYSISYSTPAGSGGGDMYTAAQAHCDATDKCYVSWTPGFSSSNVTIGVVDSISGESGRSGQFSIVPAQTVDLSCSLDVRTPAGKGNVTTGTTGNIQINQGESITVGWNGVNAYYASGPGGGKDNANGTIMLAPAVSKTYTWTFYGPAGSVTCGVNVTVSSVATAPPTTGTYMGYLGGSATPFITTNNISRADALANCQTNANNNPTSTIRCTWNGEEVYSRTAPTPSAPTLTLTANPTTVTAGGSTTLSWSSSNASSCTAQENQMNPNSIDLSGSVNSSVNTTSTLTFVCTGPGGSVTRAVTVTVNPVATTPVTSTGPTITFFTVNGSTAPGPIANGGTAIVSYASTGTNYCRVWLDPGASETTLDAGFYSSKSDISTGPITVAGNHIIRLYCWNPAAAADTKSIQFTVNSGSAFNNSQNQTASILNAFGSATNDSSTPTGTGFSYVWNHNLEIGSPYFADVTALQTALTKEGVYAGNITGGFYNQTYAAVQSFQEKYGIDSTGFVGPVTRSKLNELY